MKKLLDWIEARCGLAAATQTCRGRMIPGRACVSRAWPCLFVFAFCVQAITGFFLWAYYSPGAMSAWESVYHLQYEVTGGWLLRAVHHYSAHATLAAAMLYLLQMIFLAEYRAPRELVFWLGMGVGLCALAAIITGDLLYWDQNGYTSTKVRVGFLNLLPGIGAKMLPLATGGGDFGHLTLTRFFALHVGVFGGGLLAVALLHAWLCRRADDCELPAAEVKTPWWPNQAACGALACLGFMAIVLLLACQHGTSGDHRGVAHGSPADPAASYDAARPEWMLVGVYQLAHWYPGIVSIFVLPGVVVAIGLAMPWLAKRPAGHRFNMAFTVALLGAVGWLSWYCWAHDAGNPQHQAAIAAEREQADRTRELARGQGIPPTGALTLLRHDAKTQGPRLFKQHCASCHDYATADADGQRQGIVAEKSSAPNLYGFASRAWLGGLLDAKRIVGPDYFGNTKFKNGEMAGQVKDWWKEAETDGTVADLQKELAQAAAAVSAEAQLKSQREQDARDAAMIAAGRAIVGQMCTDCHRFDKAKGAGAPDLTGYGSRAWTRAIICNPADKRFYGEKNDRMPAYDEILTPQELDQIADWLRGEWFESM